VEGMYQTVGWWRKTYRQSWRSAGMPAWVEVEL